ncbi:acyl-CoA dehydrogenase, partial [Pseudomonas viridiflava]|uniref:acyl-CoA dehydrogenase n=1 Tax=Pseudomonas viridiflava TaxID=33069 RepID=UPI000EFD7319
MSHSTIDTQLAVAAEDLTHARQGLQQTLDYLREQGRPWTFSGVQRLVEDPYVIGKIGDLQIRLDVAAALLERAHALDGSPEQCLIASTEAVIASADALLAVDNVQHELTGQRQSL